MVCVRQLPRIAKPAQLGAHAVQAPLGEVHTLAPAGDWQVGGRQIGSHEAIPAGVRSGEEGVIPL